MSSDGTLWIDREEQSRTNFICQQAGHTTKTCWQRIGRPAAIDQAKRSTALAVADSFLFFVPVGTIWPLASNFMDEDEPSMPLELILTPVAAACAGRALR